jgi:hypothetical protein
MDKDQEQTEHLKLAEAATYLLEESRMVLPGIQALFGFQLIAVFNEGFQRLSFGQQTMHLAATTLIAIAIACIMTPAAYHRQTDSSKVTATFIGISTRLLLWSMVPLAIGVSLEFYLITAVIVDNVAAVFLGALLFAVYVTLWFVLPRTESLQRLMLRK